VRFETKRDGAGHGYVIDMLNGWRSQHKHHPDRPKAAGIVDGDAGQARTEFNKLSDNVKSAKCFVYPAPANLRAARAAHFNIHTSLETLYPKTTWDDAARRGRLAQRSLAKICHPDLVNRIISGEAALDDQLHPDWAYLVTHDFLPGHKIPTAERICRQQDEECRATLANFEPLLREALAFIGFDDAIVDPAAT